MIFSNMISLIIFLWILPSITAGQEDHFQAVHDAAMKMLNDQEIRIQQPIMDVYENEVHDLVSKPPTAVVFQKTNSSIYIMDAGGHLL